MRNFRSIGPEGIEIIVPSDEDVLVFVGPNGAGKSNVLTALAVALNAYPFNKFTPAAEDFHCKNTDDELLIELHFRDPLVERDVYQQKFEIHGFRYRAWRVTRGDGKGVLKTEHYCFGSDGKTIVKSSKIYKKAKPGEEIVNPYLPARAEDYAWKVADVFYLDAPALERFFDRTTGYSPLARLLDIYRSDFESDDNTFTIRPGETVPSREAYDRLSKKLSEILRTEKLVELERVLSSTVARYFGTEGEQPLQLQFSLPPSREFLDKWLGLYFADCADVPALPASNLGSGARALLRLAVIECLLKSKGRQKPLFLLLEEPEIYLHVHSRRYFNKVLHQLASDDSGIVMTTHSPEFVDISRPHEVVRFTKPEKGRTVVRQVPQGNRFDFGSAADKIRRLGNEEIFFAAHAVLTEGRDDQGVVGVLFSAINFDPDVAAVSIIQCDSASNLPDYIRLCGALGIDFYVIHDEDDPATSERRNKAIADAIQESGNPLPSLHLFRPRLEEAMGLTGKPGLDVLLEKLQGKSFDSIQSELPQLVEPIDEFLSSRNLVPTEDSVEV